MKVFQLEAKNKTTTNYAYSKKGEVKDTSNKFKMVFNQYYR